MEYFLVSLKPWVARHLLPVLLVLLVPLVLVLLVLVYKWPCAGLQLCDACIGVDL